MKRLTRVAAFPLRARADRMAPSSRRSSKGLWLLRPIVERQWRSARSNPRSWDEIDHLIASTVWQRGGDGGHTCDPAAAADPPARTRSRRTSSSAVRRLLIPCGVAGAASLSRPTKPAGFGRHTGEPGQSRPATGRARSRGVALLRDLRGAGRIRLQIGRCPGPEAFDHPVVHGECGRDQYRECTSASVAPAELAIQRRQRSVQAALGPPYERS